MPKKPNMTEHIAVLCELAVGWREPELSAEELLEEHLSAVVGTFLAFQEDRPFHEVAAVAKAKVEELLKNIAAWERDMREWEHAR
jgi:hypothetical protein